MKESILMENQEGNPYDGVSNTPFRKAFFVDLFTRSEEEAEANQHKSSRALIQLVLRVFMNILVQLLLVIPYIPFSRLIIKIPQIFSDFFKGKIKAGQLTTQFIGVWFQALSAVSILLLLAEYCLSVTYRVVFAQDSLWLENALLFFLSHVSIVAYIRAVLQIKEENNNNKDNTQPLIFPVKRIFKLCFTDDAIELLCASSFIGCESKYSFDICRDDKLWQNEYKKRLEEFEQNPTSQEFNGFLDEDKNPTTFDYDGYQLIAGQNEKLPPSQSQLFILLAITITKLLTTLVYIIDKNLVHSSSKLLVYKQTSDSSSTSSMNISEVLLGFAFFSVFYINLSIILNKVLSSQDLRRRTMILCKLNHGIHIPNSSDSRLDYMQVLDVTCITTIKTWDNLRRVTLQFFQSQEKKLEVCYILLFVYYITVALVMMAAYGEIYIGVTKDSPHLSPLIVLSNTFDFISLNVIILKRIFHGQKMNDAIGDTQHQLEILVMLFTDLGQMYDEHFSKEGVDQHLFKRLSDKWKEFSLKNNKASALDCCNDEWYKEEEYRYSVSDLVVAKVKHLCDYYTSNLVQWQGKVWKKSEEQEMHQELIKALKAKYERIKDQVNEDARGHSYKFLGLARIDFKETLVAVLFTAITFLPIIIPTFTSFFQKSK